MMKFFYSIACIFLLSNNSYSNIELNSGELCVINLEGANVYSNPSFISRITTNFEVGETITTVESTALIDSLKIGDGFFLKGYWLELKQNKGFVFSSDFTDKDVQLSCNKDGFIRIDLLGNLQEESNEEIMIETENGQFPLFSVIKTYKNGNYKFISFDNCFDHIYHFRGVTLSEVFHQMRSYYSQQLDSVKGVLPVLPSFIRINGNSIEFATDGASQDLRIEIKDDGSFEISSYDCT